ncbi:MAG: HAD-IA family hydrolase [Chloroflexi bacterium]|nr:HAD-IA family hydrolase [Chloroflexota bacterium]
MIQALIFDVGGVLFRTEDHAPRQQWETHLGLSPGGAEALVFNSKMGQKAQMGEISEPMLWQWIGNHLELSEQETAAFKTGFWAGDVMDRQLIALIRQLKTNYQTAVISNYADNLRTELIHRFCIADVFDEIIISAEEHIMKPNPEIFHRALTRLRCTPKDAVFIDDFKHNIQAAADIGMATIHFQLKIDLANELEKVGVNR